ncbi:MAG: UDP-N-acetylglucosamine 2-epimerase (non-hydrolyzing) [Mycobacteriales bacterium]
MKILSVVGARPQFVKLAPVAAALDQAGCDHFIAHTGQHYDHQMSDVFFEDLRIPPPDADLGVGSGSHGAQTAAMLAALEDVIDEQRPDWVLAYGDTNSTIAGALAAVKLHVPVAHLEAGLRSFNRRMPEEHNRVLTDHAADLLMAPTAAAMTNLTREGLLERSRLVGDVMTDICFLVRDAIVRRGPQAPAGLTAGNYVVSTIHRPDNTDDPLRLARIVTALQALDNPVLLVAHPRLAARAREYDIDLAKGAIVLCEPLGYPEMVAAVLQSAGVVTDSGGLQKEAYLLESPCTTIRSETEWVETLDDGWNVLDNDLERLAELAARPKPATAVRRHYGDGDAASKVAALLAAAPPGQEATRV